MKEQVEKREEAKFGGRDIFDVQIKKRDMGVFDAFVAWSIVQI